MANPYTQDKRIASFVTPLGGDEMVIVTFEGTEGVNELFEYRIEAINTKESAVNFDAAIGKNCTLTMKTIGGADRHFDGILTEAKWLSTSSEGNTYRLVLRPWLWLLSKRSNSLIFHEQNALQIIKKIFGDHSGLAKFKDSCTESYPVLEYCAQYRESDMDFVCRLMEQHGISYHFRHEKGEHTLVMGDGSAAYLAAPDSSRPFIAVDQRHHRATEHLSQWQPERKFTTGKSALNDYDFKKPSANLKADNTGDAAYAHGQLEEYDYPGKYVKSSEGTDYATARLKSLRAEDGRFFAEGDCTSLWPCHLVSLTDHPDSAQNDQYLVLRCTHSFFGERYRATSGGRSETYQGRYELMRADQPYAPLELTPKPFVHGPQTAKVVGDGEIDCDEYGRIRVRFHWDRKNDQSRLVRVAQVWASQNWGAIFTPRVGMEVVVDFLEGDPDQPIVIGCVYNGENKPPYTLPDKKNLSGWKSDSTTGGGGYNELVMDDTSGSELVRFHAQKDLESTIENDEERNVKNNRKTDIGVNDTLNVGSELFIEAGSKITLKVGLSTITMEPMKIVIDAPFIEVKAQFDLSTKSNLTARHESVVDMSIKSLMVRIN